MKVFSDCAAIIRNMILTVAIGFVITLLSVSQPEARDNVVVRPTLNCKCNCLHSDGRILDTRDITAIGGTCEEARDKEWPGDHDCKKGNEHGTMICRDDKDAGAGSSSGVKPVKPGMPGAPRPPVREKQP